MGSWNSEREMMSSRTHSKAVLRTQANPDYAKPLLSNSVPCPRPEDPSILLVPLKSTLALTLALRSFLWLSQILVLTGGYPKETGVGLTQESPSRVRAALMGRSCLRRW
jgi:hypothetical protein